MTVTRHPAKFNDAILAAIDRRLWSGALVLDCFAGTGRIHRLRPRVQTFGVELEPEWAAQSEHTIVGNALHLPFSDDTFDAISTSPCYGNRMSDSHNARDASRRNTYTHAIGRRLHPDNAGAMAWGSKYQAFHQLVWIEAQRVLHPGGLFILNTKDFYKTLRKGEEAVHQPVSRWHAAFLRALGFRLCVWERVPCSGNRQGANGHVRAEHEDVITFRNERIA